MALCWKLQSTVQVEISIGAIVSSSAKQWSRPETEGLVTALLIPLRLFYMLIINIKATRAFMFGWTVKAQTKVRLPFVPSKTVMILYPEKKGRRAERQWERFSLSYVIQEIRNDFSNFDEFLLLIIYSFLGLITLFKSKALNFISFIVYYLALG